MKQQLNTNLSELLKETLLSIQKTNEYVVALATAVTEAQKAQKSFTMYTPYTQIKDNMNSAEAAEYCGYSKSYLYQLVHKKEIPYHKPMGGHIVFRRKELDEFVSRGKQEAGYETLDKAAAIINGEVV